MPMQITDMTPMEVSPELLNDEGSINPFCQDAYNMGTKIGTNVTIMYANFDNVPCKYLIIVDTQTGERKRITFGV